MKSVKV